MQLLRLAQLHKSADASRERKLELARKVDTAYNIPDDTFKDLQDKSYPGYNCLHIAALKLDFDFILNFVNRGADPLKQGTRNGKTPIHVAVDAKRNSKMRHLWEIGGKLRDCQVTKTLLLAHVTSKKSVNPRCNRGISHLHIACMFNCVKAVKFFLNNGEAINQVTNADAKWPSYTPLHFAMRYSSVETADILLSNGADLFVKDAEGISPFHILINRLLDVADYVNMGQRAICVLYEKELERIETIIGIVLKMQSEYGLNYLGDTGLTIFHVACLLRDSSVAASFLNENFDLNTHVKTDSKFWPGWTPLHFAASSNAQTVRLLMTGGADITMKNARGETPLDMCLKRYSPKTVHSILSTKNEFKSILLSDTSNTLLDLLLSMNDFTSFLNFFEALHGPDVCVCPISPLLPGYSILHLALSMNERMKFWEHFLAETDSQDNVDSLPQVYNITEDESRLYSDRINACLERGCSVNFKNFDGSTPVHLAFKAQVFKIPIFAKLFNYCRKDSTDADGLSHLHIACASGNHKAVQTLLDAGSKVDAATKKSFQWYKKHYRSTGKIKPYLISVSAKSTPLHIAVAFERDEVVKVLLDNGANPFANDSEGYTPIHLSIAHSNGSNEIAKVIVGKPRELIELVSKVGLSHLHVAAFAGDADAIKKLIRNGANVNRSIELEVPDFLSRFAGKTPLQIVTQLATQLSRKQVALAVEALIESGADVYANDTLQCLMRDFEYTETLSRVDDVLEVGVDYAAWLQRRQQRYREMGYDFCRYFASRLRLDVNAKRAIDSSGLTLLHVACSRLDVEWATELLDKGADVNARIRNDKGYRGFWSGYTPLHALVARMNRADAMIDSTANRLAGLLLERGADVTFDSVDGTPVHLLFRAYVKNFRGSDVEPEFNDHHAMYGLPVPAWPFDDFTSSIFNSQISYRLNPVDSHGLSHFHVFCMFNAATSKVQQYLETRRVDIDRSTNPFSDSHPGYNGLLFAQERGAFNVVNVLIQRGANVRKENAHGNTSLHLLVLQNLVDRRRAHIVNLQTHGANFSAKNLLGQTAVDILMTKRHFRHADFQFLVSKGSPISLDLSPGPAALIMQNAEWVERANVFKTFINLCDVPAAVRNGYDPVPEIITAQEYRREYDRSTVDIEFLIDIVQQFVNAGCDVYRPFDRADTELNKAISHENATAVHAWLLLGGDANACDVNCQMFDPASINKIEELLALQAYKMRILGLYVKLPVNLIYFTFKGKFPIDARIDIRITAELKKAETVKITGNLSARAFLSELWAVLYYSKLPLKQREDIDAFFNKRIAFLHERFPTTCGIMISQYRKALVRAKLVVMAKDVLATECGMDLPDPCLECLLSYFCNYELKVLTDSGAEETARACKRARNE